MNGETVSQELVYIYPRYHIIQICSGITCGRVLSGELYAQRLQEVNLSAFVYRLFHEDFSPIMGTNI